MGSELAALLRPPADPDELRADSGLVTRILNAERRLALVEMADGTVVAVPYGTGRPRVGHRYPVYSTPQGDRWLKAGGQTWCKVWTLDADFNEDGATFEDDMLNPALHDRLELPVFSPFGTGADGAANFNADAGNFNLNTGSLCGRGTPDAEYRTAAAWAVGADGGELLPNAPFLGLAVGDEIVIYCAQALDGGSEEDVGNVGRWETHRVSEIDGITGALTWADYGGVPGLNTPSLGQLTAIVQRVPNYTTVTRSGTATERWVQPGVFGVDGSGFLLVRASTSIVSDFGATGKGYAGGTYSGTCVDSTDFRANAGHGKRVPKPEDKGIGVFGGGGGGATHCCNAFGPCASVPAHDALTGTSGGGGGNGAAGSAGGSSAHRVGAIGANHATGMPGGNAGALLKSGLQTANMLYGTSFMGGGGGGPGVPGGEVGGRGGGVILLAAPTINPAGVDTNSTPTIEVNGDGASAGVYVLAVGSSAGGGAAGSIVLWAETLGAVHAHAEARGLADAATGRSGLGGGGYAAFSDCGFTVNQVDPGGDGAMGPIQASYNSGGSSHLHGVVTTGGSALTFAGCWASAIYDSEALGMDPGMLVEPLTLRADWTLDSDALKPTLYLVGGDQPDLSDGVIYPQPAPAYWQDGGTHDIDDDTDLDLTPYGLSPALYWQVWACLDSGTDTGDTPTILELELCGVAS